MRLETRNTDNLHTEREIHSTMRYSSSFQTKYKNQTEKIMHLDEKEKMLGLSLLIMMIKREKITSFSNKLGILFVYQSD